MEKVLHRLVSKHIAGTTMSSALDKAKEIGSSGAGCSIMFLSSGVMEKPKAAYVTTTYLELIRRISRLGINAGVQVPLEQLGLGIGEDVALSNIKKIGDLGTRSGVFVWADARGAGKAIAAELQNMGVGVACSVEEAKGYMNGKKNAKSMKLLLGDESRGKKGEFRGEIDGIIKRIESPVLSSASDDVLAKLMSARRNERNLTFECRLGYNKKKLNKALRKGAKLSVLVPFGKDWVNYAMGNVPEGYMKFFAKRLFNDKDKGA